jgi:hypothetical protein
MVLDVRPFHGETVHRHNQIREGAHKVQSGCCDRRSTSGRSAVVDGERTVRSKEGGHAGGVLAALRRCITLGEASQRLVIYVEVKVAERP